jgi:hypothetical protein
MGSGFWVKNESFTFNSFLDYERQHLLGTQDLQFHDQDHEAASNVIIRGATCPARRFGCGRALRGGAPG